MSGLLDGVRVLDASRVLAGPFAGQALAEMGADVVKLEFRRGDPARSIGPFVGLTPAEYSSGGSRTLGPTITNFADEGGAIGLAGVMGGSATEVWMDTPIAPFPAVPDLPFTKAVIWVDRKDALPRRLEIHEQSGATRTLALSRLRQVCAAAGTSAKNSSCWAQPFRSVCVMQTSRAHCLRQC
jgi:hypothetical protein